MLFFAFHLEFSLSLRDIYFLLIFWLKGLLPWFSSVVSIWLRIILSIYLTKYLYTFAKILHYEDRPLPIYKSQIWNEHMDEPELVV